ncbi:MAG TPA: carboxypeptidase regulatory-like domain-containing protein [Kofleriaceae bacterium]|nr:carboxypeptidase regulatory-like domain-containing protein [Kofleriaceae bacterium]
MSSKRVFAIVGLVAAVAAVVWLALGRGRHRHGHAAAGATAAATTATGPHASSSAPRPDPRQQPKGTIRGTVREQGGPPLAGAQVCAHWWGDDLGDDAGRDPVCTQTAADGRYQLAGLLPGHEEIDASAAGHVPARHQEPDKKQEALTLGPGQTRDGVDLELAPGGAEVHGVVDDINGGPIADALVSVEEGGWSSGGGGSAVARTGADGTFTLWSAPGSIELEASAAGYVDGNREAIAPAHAVELLLTPESVLEGTVVEAGTHAPVAGVLVSASHGDPRAERYAQEESTRTGADGRFRLTRLEPGRYKPIAVGRGVRGEPAESVLLGLGQHVDGLVIEVSKAAVVRGRIEIERGGQRTPCEHGGVTLRSRGAAPILSPRTDDGTVELEAVPPGAYQVDVWCSGESPAPWYPPLVVGDRDLDKVWTVNDGGTIVGVVRTEAGEPVPGVLLDAESPGFLATPSFGSNATSGADGAFRLRGLPAGPYTLEVESNAHPQPEEDVRVTVVVGKESHADIVLPASGSIAGEVVDSDGRPVAGVDVFAVGAGVGRFGFGNGQRTDEEGHFVVRGIPAGEVRLLAAPPRTKGVFTPVTVVAGKTATAHIVVDRQSSSITGTVRDDSGQPVDDAWVITVRESDNMSRSGRMAHELHAPWQSDDRPVVTDASGAFAVHDLADGAYTLRAYRKGGGETIAAHVATGTSVAMVIRATGSIAGVVTSAAGPPDDLTITVADGTSGVARTEVFAGNGGRFAMRDLPAGSYAVTAVAAAGRAHANVTIAAGEHRDDLALALAGDLRVRGRIVDLATGAPLSGQVVSMSSRVEGRELPMFGDDNRAPSSQPTGDDGRFEVEAPVGLDVLTTSAVGPIDDHWDSLYPVDLDSSAAPVDLGDIPEVKATLDSPLQAGHFGFDFVPRESPPPTPVAQLQVTVSSVEAGGPAAVAGLKPGDVIVSIDGQDVRAAHTSLASSLLLVPPGTAVTFGLADGRKLPITAGVRH